jgi:ABC-2 type transport system ATP-binding protein
VVSVIDVTNLHKRYGDTVAVDDVSFSVEKGEIFGILGPNGAGKTTTVEMIEGLRTPDRGVVSVLGMDPIRQKSVVTQRLGAQLQESHLPDAITVSEALDLYASFYDNPADWDELIVDSACPTSGTPGSRNSPAARSSGCRSRWPWSAALRSPFWTSSPPDSTPRHVATRGSWWRRSATAV